MQRPFIKTGWSGLLVIGMASVLMMVFPSKAPWMMDGFFTPIIAFEFVQTKSEVYQLFGLSGSFDNMDKARSMINAMDFGNRLDYIFMVLYSWFLFSFSLVCAKITGKKYYYSACFLSVVILAADIMENIQLLRITAKIIHNDFTKELFFLHWFTWIKWGGIIIVFLILAPCFFKGRLWSRLMGVTGVLSSIFYISACFNRSILNELLALSINLMFIMMIVYCFVFKIQSQK